MCFKFYFMVILFSISGYVSSHNDRVMNEEFQAELGRLAKLVVQGSVLCPEDKLFLETFQDDHVAAKVVSDATAARGETEGWSLPKIIEAMNLENSYEIIEIEEGRAKASAPPMSSGFTTHYQNQSAVNRAERQSKHFPPPSGVAPFSY